MDFDREQFTITGSSEACPFIRWASLFRGILQCVKEAALAQISFIIP